VRFRARTFLAGLRSGRARIVALARALDVSATKYAFGKLDASVEHRRIELQHDVRSSDAQRALGREGQRVVNPQRAARERGRA
jgi:hypothetical protein